MFYYPFGFHIYFRKDLSNAIKPPDKNAIAKAVPQTLKSPALNPPKGAIKAMEAIPPATKARINLKVILYANDFGFSYVISIFILVSLERPLTRTIFNKPFVKMFSWA